MGCLDGLPGWGSCRLSRPPDSSRRKIEVGPGPRMPTPSYRKVAVRTDPGLRKTKSAETCIPGAPVKWEPSGPRGGGKPPTPMKGQGGKGGIESSEFFPYPPQGGRRGFSAHEEVRDFRASGERGSPTRWEGRQQRAG